MCEVIKCLVVDDEKIARVVLEEHISKLDNLKLVASCNNALEAFKWMSTESIDVVFLDINMPEISGLDFAKTINHDIKIVFTTAYRDYAVEGFDLKAVDYLLKPIAFDRFLQAVNKYQNENKTITPIVSNIEPEQSEFFFVRSDRKMIRINFDDIQYIESLSDYVRIHTITQNVVTRETITNLEAKLPQKEFIRIHRSYIVAIKKIDTFTNEYVEINKKMLPISRGYKQDVLNRLEEH